MFELFPFDNATAQDREVVAAAEKRINKRWGQLRRCGDRPYGDPSFWACKQLTPEENRLTYEIQQNHN